MPRCGFRGQLLIRFEFLFTFFRPLFLSLFVLYSLLQFLLRWPDLRRSRLWPGQIQWLQNGIRIPWLIMRSIIFLMALRMLMCVVRNFDQLLLSRVFLQMLVMVLPWIPTFAKFLWSPWHALSALMARRVLCVAQKKSSPDFSAFYFYFPFFFDFFLGASFPVSDCLSLRSWNFLSATSIIGRAILTRSRVICKGRTIKLLTRSADSFTALLALLMSRRIKIAYKIRMEPKMLTKAMPMARTM